MKAVLSISAAFNPFRTKQSLEERLDNRILYTRFLTNKLVDIVKRFGNTQYPILCALYNI